MVRMRRRTAPTKEAAMAKPPRVQKPEKLLHIGLHLAAMLPFLPSSAIDDAEATAPSTIPNITYMHKPKHHIDVNVLIYIVHAWPK